MSTLRELLTKSTKVKSSPTKVSTAVNSSNFVNSKDLIPIGVTVPLEKPLAFVDAKPIVPRDLVAKDQILLITAFVTKYPHYQFVKKTHSSWVNQVKFWFLDTKRNITVVASYKDMKEELEASMMSPVRRKEIGVKDN